MGDLALGASAVRSRSLSLHAAAQSFRRFGG
jgi:hypothetical protein